MTEPKIYRVRVYFDIDAIGFTSEKAISSAKELVNDNPTDYDNTTRVLSERLLNDREKAVQKAIFGDDWESVYK